jgi:anti-anti-sigma factor
MSRTLVLADPIADGAPAAAPAAPAIFECTWSVDDHDSVWIHLSGGLDAAAVPRLRRTLADPRLQARLVILDLRDLTSVETRGAHAIVDASFRARAAGRRLVVLRGPANVDRVFAITGSAYFVEISDLGTLQPPLHPRRPGDGDRAS